MKVEMHRMFEYLLKTTASEPEAVLGFSLAAPPLLGEYLDDLDPGLPLDWNNESFQGLPALRERVVSSSGLKGRCDAEDVLITAGAAEANFLVLTQLLEPGDEITLDYGTFMSDRMPAFACGCGAERCRGTIRGTDWRLPEMARYEGHVSDWVRRRRGA